jgi:hypothetical protein
MNDDPEISLMQWMSIDDLARYGDALETIEREEALYAELLNEIDPTRLLKIDLSRIHIEYKEAVESVRRLGAALELKIWIEHQARVRMLNNSRDERNDQAGN